jgi:hypothetical protein
MVDGRASNRTNHTKQHETVIEEEGRRTFEVIYEGPTVNFASVGLDASQSIDITKQSI